MTKPFEVIKYLLSIKMIEKFKSLIRFDAGEDLLPQLVFVISTLLFTHKENEEW